MSIFNRENRLLSWGQFLALVSIIGFANWLLWIWLKIPPEQASPALELMNVWGFGIVAFPTSFLIGIMGLHLAARKQER